jgi:prepilin-type N-terminal cleavage/methylation domain-containing protein
MGQRQSQLLAVLFVFSFKLLMAFALLMLGQRLASGDQCEAMGLIINSLHRVHAANQRKSKLMKTQNARSAGFTLVEIMIVVAIIGLLAAIAIPNFVKARTYSQKSGCIENLRQISSAKTTWALETRRNLGDTPNDSDLFGPINYIRNKPDCPASGSYSLQPVDTKPTCTIAEHTL